MGEWMDKARTRLREENYRLTRQREILCRVFIDNPGRHLTAEEIREYTIGTDHPLGLATVYRTLSILEDVGLIGRIDMGDGVARYEFTGGDFRPHYHLTCLECGSVTEVEWPGIKEVGDVPGIDGFEVTDHSLLFFGICSHCRNRTEDERNSNSREGGDSYAKR